MLSKSLLSVLFLVLQLSFFYANSQNLIDTSTWTVGSGSVSGFNAMGSNAENVRELGLNHLSQEFVLWKSVPDANFDDDGGWNTEYKSIDHTLMYRFSVWIKKTNSHNGTTNFGCYGYPGTILTLGNTPTNKPLFFSGDLPVLDRWYLLVGYVRQSTNPFIGVDVPSLGKIYDGVTGKAVRALTDYKFSTSAISTLHTAYLRADTNVDDRQYYVNPRLEPINGNEPTIQELLGINLNSTFIVLYDTAGSQKDRVYCEVGYCLAPTPSRENEDSIVSENISSEISDTKIFEESLKLYPNPTKAKVSILVESNSNVDFSKEITVYSATGALIKTFFIKENSVFEVDLNTQPSGVYFVHAHLTNGQHVNKKIIKE